MSVDLVDRLNEVFKLDPSAALVEQGDDSWSYQQFGEFMASLKKAFIDAGFKEGTPVGLLLRNRPACLAAAYSIIVNRRCLVTVNPLLPAIPLKNDIKSLKVPILVADKEDWENPVIRAAAKDSGAHGIAIWSDENGLYLETVREGSKDGDFRDAAPGIAIEMLTSGTTGIPKRIKLERASMSHSLWAGSRYEAGGKEGALKLKSSPSLLWMPLVHIGGLWNALYQTYNGRRILLHERFKIDTWHTAVKKHKLRFTNLPPSALKDFLDRNLPKEDFESLIAVRTGTAPLDPDLAEQFEERYDIPMLEAYGATEFAGGVAGWTIKDHREFGRKKKRGSVGRPNRGCELRVVDPETLTPLEPNEAGLLEVKTPQVDNAKSWIRTTDLAKIDEDGFIYILGRADNAINRGGFKIMPDQVEAAVRAHPAVKDVCVVGIKDDRLGQVPVTVYELNENAETPTTESFVDLLRGLLKPYEIPVRFMAVDKLPRTPSLKISRYAVREMIQA